jgi:hypothetical protein
MTRWRIWLAVLALAGGALLVACGGDDDKDDGGNGGDEPTATESADGGDGDGDADGDADGDGADLTELTGEWAESPATISYAFTSSSGSGDGSYVLYWNPPDQWRVDFEIEGSEASYIKNADGTFICSPNGDGTGTCIDYPVGVPPVPFLGTFLVAEDYENFVEGSFGGVGTDTSEETIAGISANCYSVSSNITGAESEFQWCVSDDGLPLRVKASAGGEDFTYEATSAEAGVDSADFTLPYEVLDLTG